MLTSTGLGAIIRAGATLAAIHVAGSLLTAHAQDRPTPAPAGTGASGLPVPRYVSLKSDRVHARQGPGLDHKVLWEYRRAGLPVEVIREYESWRQVRDSDGAEVWIVRSLVSDRRTALVTPWETRKPEPAKAQLLSGDREDAQPVAILEAGVIASIRSCDTRWCHVSVGDFRGYIQQSKLWGVYPGETVR
ncbi:MAG: SH3 domain-containing protein [Hyphomicrobiaceae bacterium]|nr:SH3 domain-containing protein [Hyphomicrobiaceae bacterium]